MKMHLRSMRHPGIPNRRSGSQTVGLAPVKCLWLGTNMLVRRKQGFWNAAHFWTSSVTLGREAGNATPQFSSAALDLPRRREECLHAPLLDGPPRRLLSLKTSLTAPLTSHRPRWLTKARWATLTVVQAHCWLQLVWEIKGFSALAAVQLSCFMCLSLLNKSLGGCILGQEFLLLLWKVLMSGSFRDQNETCVVF